MNSLTNIIAIARAFLLSQSQLDVKRVALTLGILLLGLITLQFILAGLYEVCGDVCGSPVRVLDTITKAAITLVMWVVGIGGLLWIIKYIYSKTQNVDSLAPNIKAALQRQAAVNKQRAEEAALRQSYDGGRLWRLGVSKVVGLVGRVKGIFANLLINPIKWAFGSWKKRLTIAGVIVLAGASLVVWTQLDASRLPSGWQWVKPVATPVTVSDVYAAYAPPTPAPTETPTPTSTPLPTPTAVPPTVVPPTPTPTETPLPTQTPRPTPTRIPLEIVGTRVRINSSSGAVRGYTSVVNCQPVLVGSGSRLDWSSALVNDGDGAVIVAVASACSPAWYRLQFDRTFEVFYEPTQQLWVKQDFVAPR